MNFTEFWIMTIIATFITRIKLTLDIYKDVSDRGYKFNLDRKENISNEEKERIKYRNFLELYLPLFNILYQLLKLDNYYQTVDSYINNLKLNDIIEKFTKEEQEEYNKKKTGFHALKMEQKRKLRLAEALTVTLKNGSTIWYEFDETKEDINFINCITILRVEGPSKYLGEDKQKRLVQEWYKESTKSLLESSESYSTFINTEPKIENYPKENAENKNRSKIRIRKK